jgi:hypothetical protein
VQQEGLSSALQSLMTVLMATVWMEEWNLLGKKDREQSSAHYHGSFLAGLSPILTAVQGHTPCQEQPCHLAVHRELQDLCSWK